MASLHARFDSRRQRRALLYADGLTNDGRQHGVSGAGILVRRRGRGVHPRCRPHPMTSHVEVLSFYVVEVCRPWMYWYAARGHTWRCIAPVCMHARPESRHYVRLPHVSSRLDMAVRRVRDRLGLTHERHPWVLGVPRDHERSLV